MANKLLLLGLSLLSFLPLHAQHGWNAVVADSTDRTPLTGAVVVAGESNSTLTNPQGAFMLELKDFPVTVKVYYVGYKSRQLVLTGTNALPDTIFLASESPDDGQVVISASRTGQRLETVVQSVDLVPQDFIVRTQAVGVQEAINRVPGVQLQKGNATIRGGSGFSYGAGSRVLVLIDEMPMLSADASDAKWYFYPVENLEQVEVVKGAASALYGSAALEGLIHLRMAVAADTAYSEARLFTNMYDYPATDDQRIDSVRHFRYGGTFAHRRKIGQVRTTSSVHFSRDQGYREGEEQLLLRAHHFSQWAPKNSEKWILRVGASGSLDKGQNYLFFRDVAQPYRAFPGTTSDYTNTKLSPEFSVSHFSKANTKTILRSRVFSTFNTNNTGQESDGHLWYNELLRSGQLWKNDISSATITGGLMYIHTLVRSDELYGNHQGRNGAAFAQIDATGGKFRFSLGVRTEANRVDTFPWIVLPVMRTGLNYEVIKGGHIRASLGQGLRYPSVAERFARTQAGAIRIFPNPDLEPERGWSSELAYRQFFKSKSWRGYVDAAAFWMQYRNMIEYVFGLYIPDGVPNPNPLHYLGFKAQNYPTTQIKGLEFSAAVEWKKKDWLVQFYGGYTHVLPLNLNYGQDRDTLARDRYLRYRRRHLVRANLDVTFKNWSVGVYTNSGSGFLNIDPFFLDALTGLKKDDYWRDFSSGTVVDVRLAYRFWKDTQVAFLVQNIANQVMMEVPGNVNAPRQFVVQFVKRW